MARSESGPDPRDEPMSDAEIDAFEDAVDDLADRVSEFLADGADHAPADIEADVDELPMSDPLDDRAVEE